MEKCDKCETELDEAEIWLCTGTGNDPMCGDCRVDELIGSYLDEIRTMRWEIEALSVALQEAIAGNVEMSNLLPNWSAVVSKTTADIIVAAMLNAQQV